MRGFITRKGNAWYAVTELPRDPSTGKRRKKWHSGFRTKKEAEAALVDILSRMQQGLYVEPSKRSLSGFMEEWLISIKATVRESTWSSYSSEVRNHVLPRIGEKLLQEVGPSDLNALYAELLSSGRKSGKGGLSPRTVRYIHAILRRALDAAVRWNLISRNPASVADPPSTTVRMPELRTWSALQLRTFLESTSDDPLHVAWVVLATTGMRRGEALGLRWSDVDFERRRISIKRALITVNYELRVEKPKTARGLRTVALDQTTMAQLRTHRRQQMEARLALGAAFEHDGLVFAQPDGSPIHPDRVTKLFQRAVAATDVPRIRLHDLRHTHASLSLQAGIHPKVVADRLGHSTVATTLDTYSHAIPALDELAAEEIASIVFGAAALEADR